MRAYLFAIALLVSFVAPPSDAVQQCQEIVANRSCTDSAPKSYLIAPGQSTMIAAPVMAGFPTACWNWSRQFQCIETDPVFSCESGTPYATVKANCSLTDASIQATLTINSITYITDATYTYRCAFGTFVPNAGDALPTGKECVSLNTTVTDTGTDTAAAIGVAPSTGTGNPPTVANTTTTTIVTDQKQVTNYVCYSPPVTTCTDTCFKTVTNAATGQVTQEPIACSGAISNCTTTKKECANSLTTVNGTMTGSVAQGPDGRCVNLEESKLCTNGSTPRCLNKDNCTLSATAPADIQANGVALTENQTYICSNTTTSCGKMATVSNCVHSNAWGWDEFSIKNNIGEGLGEVNQAMSKIAGIQKGMDSQDPYIFSGQSRKCHYAIGNFLNTLITIAIIAVATGGAGLGFTGTTSMAGEALASAAGAMGSSMTALQATAALNQLSLASTALDDASNSKAFGSDCCKDYVIEGSDAWFRFGSCSLDEVRLAVAKRKGLYHYLGEYCSKKSGFPIKQCVEKTRSYCTFDDMLALTVNEQGRQQLDAISIADTTTTQSTPMLTFPIYSPEVTAAHYKDGMANGLWVKRTTSFNSQIWTWQYPGYCVSLDKQKAAYALWNEDINIATSQNGVQPGQMTPAQKAAALAAMESLISFQDCPETPGMLAVLTCSKKDDTCDATHLPEGPSDVNTDLSGTDIATADVNWRIQQFESFKMPGDYGVTATLPGDATYAAVPTSVNEFITATGSCHVDGTCKYLFAITDKQLTNGLGARKRSKDYAQFPLYAKTASASWPTIGYLSKDGVLDTATYLADPNKGLGTPLTLGTQKFIFHPNDAAKATQDSIHSHVFLEWAWNPADQVNPEKNYEPLLVPTSLPPATTGWYPHGDATDNKKHFYISGGCDANSRWCDYELAIDLTVPRHPWGSDKHPRCWGFTLEQMAALDFDKMDLSKWVDSLNLDQASAGLSTSAAKALTDQATSSAQTFYSAFKTGGSVNNPNTGTLALVVNTNTLPFLSTTEDGSYTVHAAVPANWPAYYDDQANTNPVTNVKVNWGDGSPVQSMTKTANNRAYELTHDYGNKPPGTYHMTVTLDTNANGSQSLGTNIKITPDNKQTPANPTQTFQPGTMSGKLQGEYVPSMAPGGVVQSQAGLETLAPGMADIFDKQGGTVTAPAP